MALARRVQVADVIFGKYEVHFFSVNRTSNFPKLAMATCTKDPAFKLRVRHVTWARLAPIYCDVGRAVGCVLMGLCVQMARTDFRETEVRFLLRMLNIKSFRSGLGHLHKVPHS